MITNGWYKGDYYIIKNAVKSSVCEIEPFRWMTYLIATAIVKHLGDIWTTEYFQTSLHDV